jgi:hypothetical protein
MAREVLPKVLVVLQLPRDGRPIRSGPHTRVVTDRRIGQRLSLPLVNEVAHRRIEAKPPPTHRAKERSQSRIASPPSPNHALQRKRRRHLPGRPSHRFLLRRQTQQMPTNPRLQLQLRSSRPQPVQPAQRDQLRLQPIPARKLVSTQLSAGPWSFLRNVHPGRQTSTLPAPLVPSSPASAETSPPATPPHRSHSSTPRRTTQSNPATAAAKGRAAPAHPAESLRPPLAPR